jgi:hypothetical protein
MNGTSYSWVASATPNLSGFTPSGSGNSIGNATITNNSTSIGTIDYIVTPVNNGCSGMPVTFTITVTPKPLIPNQNIVTCSDVAFITPLLNNPPLLIIPSGTNYTWTVNQPTGITGAINQIIGVGTISQTLSNSTNAKASQCSLVITSLCLF